MDAAKQITHNIKCHNEIAFSYEHAHGEIFNPIEQERLQGYLKKAIDLIRTNAEPKVALDYGCGSGNLTRHLIHCGLFTIAADVSDAFLSQVRDKYLSTRLVEILKINGMDLSGLSDNSIDLAATYSVLHHVPDYFAILREMTRVVKPGGIIYIDHEPSPSFWHGDRMLYAEFLNSIQASVPSAKREWGLYLRWKYYMVKLNMFFNPRYRIEGDLHVWPDDHVEIDEIKAFLAQNKFDVLVSDDYLLFKKHYDPNIYKKYRDICNDTSAVIARKRPE
jgi:ubiquinone/menaquinone biosynthesis C-methylase UbiE